MTVSEIFRGVSQAKRRFKATGEVYEGFFLQGEWEALDDALTYLARHVGVSAEEYDGTFYCVGCKSPVLKTDNYCHECGRPINWYKGETI